MRARHETLKKGATVRLDGYMPARVLSVYRDTGALYAECRVTVRRDGVGPHGYRPGEIVNLRAERAVPRDCIYVRRGTFGRIAWYGFGIVLG